MLKIILSLVILVGAAPEFGTQELSSAVRAQRNWPSFFAAFSRAVKSRDKMALRPMLSAEIYFSGGSGDDNHDGDTRDEAFSYWDGDSGRMWQRMARALAGGSVEQARWWHNGLAPKIPTRVAPAAANVRRNTRLRLI